MPNDFVVCAPGGTAVSLYSYIMFVLSYDMISLQTTLWVKA